MKRIALSSYLLFLVCIAASGQAKGLKYVDRNSLMAYINFLASDELQGRETGTNSNNTAALYIESNLRRLGLKAPFDNNSFLQKIQFVSKRTLKTTLTLYGKDGGMTWSTDSILTLLSGPDSVIISGELVFAGYGFEDEKTGYSDLKDVDIRNRIVLVMTRNTDMANNQGNDDDYLFDQMVEGEKISSLLMRGPKAIIMVYDPRSSFSDPYESRLAGYFEDGAKISLKEYQMPDAPAGIFFISEKTADRLISTTGLTLRELQEKIDSERKPQSAIVGDISVEVTILTEAKEFTSYNVIGLVEGSDPLLRNECVIYTSHFDHVGIDSHGEIRNGADDNASGTAGMLEIADAFIHLKKKPSRTIIFAWVNAEEKGLLGSGFYASHPVIPMDKTIVDINLDMIGRSISPADTGNFFGTELNVTGPDEIQLFSGNVNSEIKKIALFSAHENGITIKDMGKDLPFGSSDHASLAAKGVPFLFFHSGIHADLHGPGDDTGKIDFDKMEKVSKMVFSAGYRIANAKKR